MTDQILSIEIVVKNVNQVLQEIQQIKGEIQKLSTSSEYFHRSIEGALISIQRQAERAGTFIGHLNEAFNKFNKTLITTARWVASYHLVHGISNLFYGSIQLLDDFNKGLTSIGAQAQLTSYEMEKLGNTILRVMRESLYAPKELLNITGVLARAGLSSKDIEKLLPYINKLGVLTNEKIETIGELMVSIQALYGLTEDEVKRASNVLMYALNQSKLGIKDVADAFKYIAPAVAVTNESFTDVMATLMVLKDVAQMTGSTLGTSYRQITQELVALTPRMRKYLQENLGLSTKEIADILNYQRKTLIEIGEELLRLGVNSEVVLSLLGRRGGSSLALFLEYLERIKVKQQELNLIWSSGIDLIDISFERYKNSLYALNFFFNSVRADIINVTKDLAPAIVQLTYTFQGLFELIKKIASSPLTTFILSVSGTVIAIRGLQAVVTGIIPALTRLGETFFLLGNSMVSFNRVIAGITLGIGSIISVLELFGVKLLSAADKFQLFGSIITSVIAFRINPALGTLVTLINAVAFAFQKLSNATRLGGSLVGLEKAVADFNQVYSELGEVSERLKQIDKRIEKIREYEKKGKLTPQMQQELENLLKTRENLLNKSQTLEKQSNIILNQISKEFDNTINIVTQRIEKLQKLRGFQERFGAPITAPRYIEQYQKQINELEKVKKVLNEIRDIEIQIRRLSLQPQTNLVKSEIEKLSSRGLVLLTLLEENKETLSKLLGEKEFKQLQTTLTTLRMSFGQVKEQLRIKPDTDRFILDANRATKSIENLTDRITGLKEQLKDLMDVDITPRGLNEYIQVIKKLDELETNLKKLHKTKTELLSEKEVLDVFNWIKITLPDKIISPQDILRFYKAIFSIKDSKLRDKILGFFKENSKLFVEALIRGLEEIQTPQEFLTFLKNLKDLSNISEIKNNINAIVNVISNKFIELVQNGNISLSTFQKIVNNLNLSLKAFGKTQEEISSIIDTSIRETIRKLINDLQVGVISEGEFGRRLLKLFQMLETVGLDTTKYLNETLQKLNEVSIKNLNQLEKRIQQLASLSELSLKENRMKEALIVFNEILKISEDNFKKFISGLTDFNKVRDTLEILKRLYGEFREKGLLNEEDIKRVEKLFKEIYGVSLQRALLSGEFERVRQAISNLSNEYANLIEKVKEGDIHQIVFATTLLKILHQNLELIRKAHNELAKLKTIKIDIKGNIDLSQLKQGEIDLQKLALSTKENINLLEQFFKIYIPGFTGFESLFTKGIEKGEILAIVLSKNKKLLEDIIDRNIKVLQEELNKLGISPEVRTLIEDHIKALKSIKETYIKTIDDLGEASIITLKQKFLEGKISIEELRREIERFDKIKFEEVWNRMFEGASKAEITAIIIRNTFKRAFEDIKTDAEIISDAFMTLWNSLAKGFSNIFVSAVRGDLEGVKNAFFKMIDAIVEAWLKALAQMALMRIFQWAGISIFPMIPIFGMAKGGIIQGNFIPIRKFAYGGIVDRPTLGLIGEGKNKEAIVPLPDNKHIPVKFIDKPEKPKIEAQIINVIDPNLMKMYLSSTSGQQTILNIIGLHKDIIKRIILS